MDKYSGQGEILPKFNLQWYNNVDSYSEGDIEDVIVQMIGENESEDYTETIARNYSWSTFYHLTHIRENILNWYPFKENSSVLEIGCGFGAITNMLCRKCRKVTAVELSKRRATGALLRCKDKENLEIIVGNLNDITFEEKFDYITLIGVLEYQGKYTDGENPYLDFLKKVKSLLKPEGKLLVAIENQYGLKYWCGAREDHTGIPFDGINQYVLSNSGVRTFSKVTLQELLGKSGFENTYFYYPMPDYKLPSVVYSQKYLPNDRAMSNIQFYYVPDDKTVVADEKQIYEEIIRNNTFEFFSNSFLVECSETAQVGDVTFAVLNHMRAQEYRLGTRIFDKDKVEKFSVAGEIANTHMNTILENEKEMENRGLHIWKYGKKADVLVSEYCESETLETIILAAYRKNDVETILNILDKVYEQVLMSSEAGEWENNIMYDLSPELPHDKEKYGVILKKAYIDMVLSNAFWIDEEIWWFDQEWMLDNTPAGFVMYWLLMQFYAKYPESSRCIALQELAERYGLAEAWKDFQIIEGIFADCVMDKLVAKEIVGFCGNVAQARVNSLKRLM